LRCRFAGCQDREQQHAQAPDMRGSVSHLRQTV
jgi:hypothetical protein